MSLQMILNCRRVCWSGIFLVAWFLAAGAGCHRQGEGQTATISTKRPPPMVTVAGAISNSVPVYLDEIGKTLAVESVAIVPQVGGKLTAVHFVDGAYVQKGQLLFEIDPRPFEAALASATAAVAQATAELEWAKIEERRVKGLFSESSATEFEYDQKRVAVAVAESKLEGAKASVESAKLDLEYSKIYSPLEGRAGARLVDPGNVVKANDRPLLVIQRMDPIYAEFTVTENALGAVRKHIVANGLNPVAVEQALRVQVDVPGNPADIVSSLKPPDSQPASTVAGGPAPASRPASAAIPPREGKLTFLDNTVQTSSGTVKLRATLPNADRYFWPGQFVNVRLVLTTKQGAVLIPAQAQQIGQQGPFVYVVDQTDTANIRPITPGQRHGDMLAVDHGLKVGERVIVAGHMMVMPGGKVTVINGVPGQGPPGPPPQATAMKK